jgi:hypothetical protein
MKTLLHTHAGKGTVGITLAALLLAWPPALSWMVAAAAIVFAAGQFRRSFERIDASCGIRDQPEAFDAAAAIRAAARG